MIRSLHIKDYLLIPDIQIDFSDGLTVITGETGAGKSLIVDSIELALGSRADTDVIRNGCDKAEIYVNFEVHHPAALQWLKDRDLYEGDECIIRRTIYRNQSSRGYLNGQPATLQVIKELTSIFVELHGQHEHQKLLTPSYQRSVLDGFGGISPLSHKIANLAKKIREHQANLDNLEKRRKHLTEELEIAHYQSETLNSLNPQSGEFSLLKDQLLKATHAEELTKTLQEVSYFLAYQDESNVSDLLTNSIARIERLAQYDESLSPFAVLLDEAKVRVDDVAREIHSISNRSEADPRSIETVNERMTCLQQQARLHQTDADCLPQAADALAEKIHELQSELEDIDSIDSRVSDLLKEYNEIASKVSAVRKQSAQKLSAQVTKQMQSLGMEGGVFSVDLTSLPDDQQFTGYGLESVNFLVSANPGQSAGPLSKVASGGELSRLSLAIQVTAAGLTEVSTLIFDEIDIGIGGKVAERVGNLLRTLGENCQIFCITHLPQVAAKGHHQLNVLKKTGDTANVEIAVLDAQQRISEVARMLGGAKITARTMDHAREMLSESLN